MRRTYTFIIHVKSSIANSTNGDGTGVDTDGDGKIDEFVKEGSELTEEETLELLEAIE